MQTQTDIKRGNTREEIRPQSQPVKSERGGGMWAEQHRTDQSGQLLVRNKAWEINDSPNCCTSCVGIGI